MKSWTTDRLNQLIVDSIEESSTLEYKRAAALVKNDDKKKADLVKHVTAMANAAGGTIIYGIAEFNEKPKRHLPEKLDPVDLSEISREWLDSIIQSIQPRIDGVIIHPVTIDEDTGQVCYVVEVPKSHTAHQARDHVYYQRRNFQVLAMEDYEVRDVMNRKSHPQIKASIMVTKSPNSRDGKGELRLQLENVGQNICMQYMAHIEIPVDLNGYILFGDDLPLTVDDDGNYFYRLNLLQNLRKTPLFPGATVTLRKEFTSGEGLQDNLGNRPPSTSQLIIKLYADEMPAINCVLPSHMPRGEWMPLN
jgi:hypothetical protein